MKYQRWTDMTIHCLKCDKTLPEFGAMHPMKGLHFSTYGHYGSTFFDPMNGSTLNVFVCDDCLSEAFDAGKAIIAPK